MKRTTQFRMCLSSCTTVILMVTAALIIPACMTTEQMAPPVDERLTAIGKRRGVTADVLANGRRTYLVDCGRCHTIEPIARYSLAEWEELLPEMAVDAKLDYDETEHLTLYIEVAHALLTETPSQGQLVE